MRNLPRLSKSETGSKWLKQFSGSDRSLAEMLLDAMLLMNEEQVSAAIRKQLDTIARTRKGKRRRVALYVEREFAGEKFFKEELIRDHRGRVRRRAVGTSGPAAIKPLRGGPRVGSEGLVAFLVSQEKEAWPRIFINQPGPDRLRAKTGPAGLIVIVTDFIGSGERIRTILDKLWAVHTVRAWTSRHWVDFAVVAAAATPDGLSNVQHHRLRPNVFVEQIAPTVTSHPDYRRTAWESLLNRYGPASGRGSGRYGFRGVGALIAFSYRIPNNTPAAIHQTEGSWQALYTGPAPPDLREVFGIRTPEEIASNAASNTGIALADDLQVVDQEITVILSLLRGRWRAGSALVLAERTGLSVPDVADLMRKALKDGLITKEGRLTDAGQLFLQASRRGERRRPRVPTSTEPYYPMQLRTPREPSSTRRPSGRP
jgi:hypothetical protein